MPWSVDDRVPLISTGTISRSNQPSSVARGGAAVRLRRASSSSSERGISYSSAISSAPMPWPRRRGGRRTSGSTAAELAPDLARRRRRRCGPCARRRSRSRRRGRRTAISAAPMLTACCAGAALQVDRRRRRLDRQALLQPGVAGDVHRLLADLLHAAGDHVLDLGRDRRPSGSSTSRVGQPEQVRRVDVLVVPFSMCPRPIGVRTASTITTSRPPGCPATGLLPHTKQSFGSLSPSQIGSRCPLSIRRPSLRRTSRCNRRRRPRTARPRA